MNKKVAPALFLGFVLLAGGNSVWGGYEEGHAAFQRGDYETALEEFRPLAAQGDPFVQFVLGACMPTDSGFRKTTEKR